MSRVFWDANMSHAGQIKTHKRAKTRRTKKAVPIGQKDTEIVGFNTKGVREEGKDEDAAETCEVR